MIGWIGVSVFLLSANFGLGGSNVSSKSLSKSEFSAKKLFDKNELSDLTTRIVALSVNTNVKNRSKNLQREANFSELAETRYEKLSELIENDTAEVLRVALPDAVLSKIPEKLRDNFEKREEISGELEVVAACEENGGRILYYLNTEEGRVSLYFAKQPENELLTGAKVRVKGVSVGGSLAIDENVMQSDSKDFEITAPAVLPNTLGEQKLLVLLVNFQNNISQPFTVEQTNNLIFNTANAASVTNYYREVSFQRAWINGDVRGWFTLNMSDGCDYRQVAIIRKTGGSKFGREFIGI